MSQIVHITFEKLTGLKGEIEGDFMVSAWADLKLPMVFLKWRPKTGFRFRQGENLIDMMPVEPMAIFNYKEHFQYGTNFLIKSWSYGGGVTINSQPPN